MDDEIDVGADTPPAVEAILKVLPLASEIAPALETAIAEVTPPEAEAVAEAEQPPVGGIQQSTKIKYDPLGESYLAGKCAVTVSLTLLPEEAGHPEGRLVILGVRSHHQAPLLGEARLNTLALPSVIADLLAQYEASLPARGAQEAARLAQAKAQQKAEAEKRAQAEADRKAKVATKAAQTKAEKKPEKAMVEKSPTPAQLAAEVKAKAKADLLAQAKAEAEAPQTALF